jgi:CRP-like cAMP-binding protein
MAIFVYLCPYKVMKTTFETLKNILQLKEPVSDEIWHSFTSIWQPYSVKRKEYITRTGDTERYLYFVTKGVQRVVYFDQKGREATLVFTYAPSFGGVLDSFMLQKPSLYDYESLTPSEFIRTTYHDLNQMKIVFPQLERLISHGLSATISGLLERMVELQCFSAEEKFRKLLQRSPHILQLVPHKYLANYLGIDPTNFSKFINNVKI